jgi:hypothetical protein
MPEANVKLKKQGELFNSEIFNLPTANIRIKIETALHAVLKVQKRHGASCRVNN